MSSFRKFTIPVVGLSMIIILVLAVGLLNNIPGASGRCDTTSFYSVNTSAALPPKTIEEATADSDMVIEGEVCKISKTYKDGDAKRRECPIEEGCVGSGQDNSQDVIIRVTKVLKGIETRRELRLKKPISAYLLKEGDYGVFYITGDRLDGEYWPNLYSETEPQT